MAKLNSQPKADITLLFLNFSVCVVSPLWWLNTCLNQWNIPLSLFLAPENKFSDQAVQMWINEHPTSTLSHHYPIRICRRKDIFFFYRQLLSVMNKNVLRILPRSVVGGLKKKELSRAAASTPFAFPSWFLSDSTSGCESVEGACWHCCSPAGTHRASSPLPCQWASVCTFRPVTASYTTPIVTIPQFRKQPEVASLPHSLLPSLPVC